MAVENYALCWLSAILLLLFQMGSGTLTPLFLDSLNPTSTAFVNVTWPDVHQAALLPSAPSWHRIDPFFCIWISMGFDSLLLGAVVLLTKACRPGSITEREERFPKHVLLLSGSFQAVSAILYQFSTSGSRTPPFLFGVLGYFYVPTAFLLRFMILRKRPTRKKIYCVAVIMVAEFVSLAPTMFPKTESEADRRKEGGATGIGRILWPVCRVSSSIPHAIWSIILERTVKMSQSKAESCDISDQSLSNTSESRDNQRPQYVEVEDSYTRSGDDDRDPSPEIRAPDPDEEASSETNETTSERYNVKTLNMSYVMFWNFLGTFLTTVTLFWVDLIPGFGLMPDIQVFGRQFLFNVQCILGARPECGFHQIFTAWGRMLCKTCAFFTLGFLLRYGEGANFYAIFGSVRQPIIFTTFTLFDEQPFRWHPHATLSTWLNLGSLAVMFPAVIAYSRSHEYVTPTAKRDLEKVESGVDDDDGERSPLIHPSEEGTSARRPTYESTTRNH